MVVLFILLIIVGAAICM
ncbi:YjcZ family sporulation protein [Heyndrickxia vini]|uniref:YjcZ family sporulation protein n=1 Tax=Heyndrickxia vini TaxID=1476025 RepID=A0ABX7E872_9BACI|nr:YjcZ family sporulation protein [Heyndrickxia vini]